MAKMCKYTTQVKGKTVCRVSHTVATNEYIKHIFYNFRKRSCSLRFLNLCKLKAQMQVKTQNSS